jgi:hypothetical protein
VTKRAAEQHPSLILRVLLQSPTIFLSTLTVILISRTIGPVGRAEVSQTLLLTNLASNILCIPIFLTLMNLQNTIVASVYIRQSIFLFSRRNLATIAVLDISFYLLNRTESQNTVLLMLALVNTLFILYFIASQLRDFLLRINKNEIYALDFIIQIMVLALFLISLKLQIVNTRLVILIFVFSYTVYTLTLLIVMKFQFKVLDFHNLLFKFNPERINLTVTKIQGSFAASGILFQIVLSKDAILGIVFLSKSNFGLMSALASFWIVLRFLRPITVLQNRLGDPNFASLGVELKEKSFFNRVSSHATGFQAFAIFCAGIFGFFLTPKLMGVEFKANLWTSISGIFAEVILMRCLYLFSMRKVSSYHWRCFLYLGVLQFILLFMMKSLGNDIEISTIWFSSILLYVFVLFALRRSPKLEIS